MNSKHVSEDEVLILGIDPGSISTGYALIETSGRNFQILRTGTCKLKSSDDFFNRIKDLNEYFKKLVEGLPPYELALESLIHVKNVSSLAKLAQARGAILAAVGKTASRVSEYSPNLVKSTVSGYGLSSKQSLEKSLGFIFPEHKFESHDESDALAIALCHSFKRSGLGAGGEGPLKKNKRNSLKESLKHLAEK